jgi:hypothetical protein
MADVDSYYLSSKNSLNSNKEYIFVKLTDSALKCLEDYQKNQVSTRPPNTKISWKSHSKLVRRTDQEKRKKKVIRKIEIRLKIIVTKSRLFVTYSNYICPDESIWKEGEISYNIETLFFRERDASERAVPPFSFSILFFRVVFNSVQQSTVGIVSWSIF